MRSLFLTLTILFLAANVFSQVLQKKQTIAPVVQKPEPAKMTTQTKTAVTNPAISQTMAPRDTANAKIADITLDMVYSECYSMEYPQMITVHYKPEIDVFDKNNTLVAHWDSTNAIQNQTSENHPGDINGFSQAFHVTLSMKVENTSVSLASFETGKFKISVTRFFDQLTGGGNDCFSIKNVKLTLKFSNPSTIKQISQDVYKSLTLKNQSTEFYFSCANHNKYEYRN